MKNKKGFAWIKTIIFFALIALFTILVIFIMDYIKNQNKNNLAINKSELKLQDNLVYSPLDDISSYYVLAYKNSNFQNASTIYNSALAFETNNNIYLWDEQQANYYQYSSNPIPHPFTISKNETSLLIGNDLNIAHKNVVDEGTYFNGTSGVKSFAICYNCNIEIDYFNFNMYYNYPASNFTSNFYIYFYIYTDSGSMRYTSMYFGPNNNMFTFQGTNILNTLPNATRVYRFGFGFAQNSNTNDINFYLPQHNGTNSNTNGINYIGNVYNTYYNSLTQQQKDNLCYISFADTPYPQQYQDGYNAGYSDGINNQLNVINELNRQITNLTNEINSMNDTIENQTIIINDLQNQLNQQNTNFKGFFFTMADVPVRTISNILGFEVFGVNMFNFFVGIITALGCVWLIKKFI